MDPTPSARLRPQPDLEGALCSLLRSIQAWEPRVDPSVEELLAGVSRLQACFDPRTNHLPTSLCLASVKLLEQLPALELEGQKVAVDVIAELMLGLGESLTDPLDEWAQPELAQPEPEEPEPSSGSTSGLSLTVDTLRGQLIGEFLIKMAILSQGQVDKVLVVQSMDWPRRPFGEVAVELGFTNSAVIESALRLQARAHGVTPEPQGDDPWGANPL